MSGNVHPWIRKKSQAEANAEFDTALDWLENVVGIRSIGRFQTYRATLSKVFRRLLENRSQVIPADIPPSEYIETRFEAQGLIEIWKQFKTDQSSLLAEKLKKIVRGTPFTSSEGRKTEPRDILFELEMAAFLQSCGLAVDLGQVTDLTFEFQNAPILCECKRIQTPNALSSNLQIAESQLRDALGRPENPQNTLGMIALDVSRIVHLDKSGAERYPVTKYGTFELPSNMVIVQDQLQFEEAVKQRLNSFVEQHPQAFGHEFLPRVAGLVLFYKIPAVELKGDGRIFILTYPKISSFASATPAEFQLLKDFHGDMLNKFRR
jgi:hypothetical protein